MTTTLATLRKGEKGKIDSIVAGKDAAKRLYEIGLNTRASIHIIKNDIGPIIVSINGNKVAVGRGLAEKVMILK